MPKDCPVDATIRCAPNVGLERRLWRLLPGGRAVIVPVDDSLIFGPAAGLEEVGPKVALIARARPDAILAFPGVFKAHAAALLHVGGIVNLTASTVHSEHTWKAVVGSVELALQLGVEAVAVHVNVTSSHERDMLRTLGAVARECEHLGVPLMAIMYPRRGTRSGPDDNYDQMQLDDLPAFTRLVAHSARIGVDLGANLIKTKYTGTPDSFADVVAACRPVPVIVAGGPVRTPLEMLQIAGNVVTAGGAGVSFGRNTFGKNDPGPFIAALRAVVHENLPPRAAAASLDQAPLGKIQAKGSDHVNSTEK